MSGEWLLEAAAGVGVAFAGFVSLFLVLARRDGSFAPSDALRIRGMVILSVSAVFMAVLPGLLNAVGATEVWRISSVTFLIAIVAGGAYFIREWLSLRPEDRRELGLVNDVASWLLPSIAGGLQLANVLEILSGPSFGLYIVGIWLCMGSIGATFVTFMFRRLLGPPAA